MQAGIQMPLSFPTPGRGAGPCPVSRLLIPLAQPAEEPGLIANRKATRPGPRQGMALGNPPVCGDRASMAPTRLSPATAQLHGIAKLPFAKRLPRGSAEGDIPVH